MLVFYEHLITFEHEVQFLQKRRMSAATWIFVSNRYILLAFAVQSIAPYGSRVSRLSNESTVAASDVDIIRRNLGFIQV